MVTKSYILGIGGIFFSAKNPSNLQDWYREKLGFSPQVPFYEDDDAITFPWKTKDNENHCTVWAPFPNDTRYYDPSEKDWMINYIVKDIEKLLIELSNDGIKQIGELIEHDYGQFAAILDPEGNKIEFWEPNKKFFSGKYK